MRAPPSRWSVKNAMSAMHDDAAWSDWDAASEGYPDEPAVTSRAGRASDDIPDVAPDTSPLDASDALDAAFADLLRSLRAVPGPCAPPVGEGAFDILFANAREIVVWYAPAKDGVEQREVSIPARLARVAWGMLLRGEPVDTAAFQAVGTGASGVAWLFALFAQLPTVEVRGADAMADEQPLTLRWRGADDSQSA